MITKEQFSIFEKQFGQAVSDKRIATFGDAAKYGMDWTYNSMQAEIDLLTAKLAYPTVAPVEYASMYFAGALPFTCKVIFFCRPLRSSGRLIWQSTSPYGLGGENCTLITSSILCGLDNRHFFKRIHNLHYGCAGASGPFGLPVQDVRPVRHRRYRLYYCTVPPVENYGE